MFIFFMTTNNSQPGSHDDSQQVSLLASMLSSIAGWTSRQAATDTQHDNRAINHETTKPPHTDHIELISVSRV